MTRSPLLSLLRPLLLGVASAALFGVVLWLAIKVFPGELARTEGIRDASKRAEEIGRTRTAVLAMLAGTLAAIGAYYTHKSFGLNRETLDLSRQGQITERFTRAVDQLGHEQSVDVRLGGIYALERVARESRDDHRPIIEILTAYVRGHAPLVPDATKREAQNGDDSPAAADSSGPTIDVQAALTVLGRRIASYDEDWKLDLNTTALTKANLTWAHLRGADLSGADLSEAHLGGANLVKANRVDANLDGAHLVEAHLSEANLVKANRVDADLRRADLRGADLRAATSTGRTSTRRT